MSLDRRQRRAQLVRHRHQELALALLGRQAVLASAVITLSLGNLLHRLGRRDEAERCYRDALARKPEFAEAHNNLGIVLGEMGRPDEAAQCRRIAVDVRDHSRPGASELSPDVRQRRLLFHHHW